MEIPYLFFLYLSFGILLGVIFLIFNNIRQGKKLNKALKEIKMLKNYINSELSTSQQVKDDLTDFKSYDLKNAKSKKRFSNVKNNKFIKNIFSKQINFDEGFLVNILDKIGIFLFLIGIVFFVSLSMELDWINNFGRLFFGILLSGILLILGYLLYRRLPNFSSVLFGGAVSTLIFTIFSAFYKYHILSAWLSFSLLIILIASAVLISIVINKEQLAIITFLAAFISPFTVKIAGGDYLILFLYLTILNLGVIAYDYFRKSLIINLISFLFTYSIYSIWLITEFLKRDDIPLFAAFVFLTLFYIMIFIILIINNIRENRKFIPLEFTGLVTATAMYYSVGVILINKSGMEYQGVFTAFIAVINYVYFIILYKKKNFDRRILNLFLSLTIMFAALTFPVEYFGKSVTLVWAIQAVALLYIAMRSDLRPMYGGSLNLTLGTIFTLIYNLYDQYLGTITQADFKPFLNEGFFTSIIAVFGFVAIIILLNKSPYDYFYFKFLKVKVYQGILAVIALVTFYFTIRFELEYYFLQNNTPDLVIDTYLSIFNLSLLFLVVLATSFSAKKQLKIVSFAAGSLMFLIYMIFYYPLYVNLRNEFLLSVKLSYSDYFLHYYAIALLFIVGILNFKNLYKLTDNQLINLGLNLFATFLILFLISAEISNFFVIKQFKPHILIQDLVLKIHRLHYSIAYGIVSLIMIIVGIFTDYKELRISAFVLYLFTFFKIFIYDFKVLDTQELTIVFSTLGVVMLISSFFIQFFSQKQLKKVKNGI